MNEMEWKWLMGMVKCEVDTYNVIRSENSIFEIKQKIK
jgi:hypothetical protein